MKRSIMYHQKLFNIKQRGSYKAISKIENDEAKRIKMLVDQIIEGDFEKFNDLKHPAKVDEALRRDIDKVNKFNENPTHDLSVYPYRNQLDYICLCIVEVMVVYLMKYNRENSK